MPNLTNDTVSWLADGRRTFLKSGEIPYFRVRREDWADRLAALRDAGGSCVATCVPWLLHEPEEGRFDFTTHHLEAFLEASAKAGLSVLVRPGPYQYAELAYDGLPGWLCEGYPDVLARRLDGTPFRRSSISYLHPLFLDKAKRWYDAVLPRIVPHLSTRGGAVSAAQIDNELIGIHEWFGTWDYHPETMGVGREEGRWPTWLRQRHGSLAAANGTYGTTAGSWSALRPILRAERGTLGERRLLRDWQEFYFGTIAEYAVLLGGWMREGGIDVPLVHNSPNPYMNAYFTTMVKQMGPGFVLGSDHYYNLDLDWDQNHPTPKYASKCACSMAQLRDMGAPPTVWEIPGGSCSDWPPITPADGTAAYMINLAYGMKGFNYYIFAGGPNPPGAGTTTDLYDYGAAVDPLTGERRPLWHAQRSFHGFMERHHWLTAARLVADCRIAWCGEYANSARYAGDRNGLAFSSHEAWAFMRKGLFITASCAGLSPDFIALEGDGDLPTDLPLLVAAGTSMPRAAQARLVRFLDRGGRLLLTPVVPVLDEDFQPCRLLADRLGADGEATAFGPDRMPRCNAHGVANVRITGTLFSCGALPVGAEATAEEERTRTLCGWHRRFPGGGAATVLGLQWKHSHREHERMLRSVLAQLSIVPTLTSTNPNLWSVLRSDGTNACLFVMNLFTTPFTTSISFTDPASGRTCDTGPLTVPGATVIAWTPEQGVVMGG